MPVTGSNSMPIGGALDPVRDLAIFEKDFKSLSLAHKL
jgi:hypothetical protein